MLNSVDGSLVTEVSGQPTVPIFKAYEISQNNYHFRLFNISEERRFNLHHGGSLKEAN